MESEQFGVEFVLDDGGGDLESLFEVIEFLDDKESTVSDPVLIELDVVFFVEVEIEVPDSLVPIEITA